MVSQTTATTERAERERTAYDEDGVWETSHAWHARVSHVLESPNTQAGEEVFHGLLRRAVAGGGSALDVGAADGWSSRRVLDMGASHVTGIDVAERAVAKARREHDDEPRLEFHVHDAQQPIDGEFDLIFGRSVLHHLDFREFLMRICADNLRPGGRLMFMEPLSHPFSLAFHRLVPSAHTPDEWPIRPRDLRWMRRTLGVEVVPVNLISFPTAIATSFMLPAADNALNRVADAADRRLARRRRLRPWFRQGIITAVNPR